MTFATTQPVAGGATGAWVYDFTMLPYAGYFVIEGLELGLNPAGVNVHTAGDTTTVQMRILFAPAYNFHTPTMVTPFIEGLAGLTSSSLMHSGSTKSSSGFTFGYGHRAAFAEGPRTVAQPQKYRRADAVHHDIVHADAVQPSAVHHLQRDTCEPGVINRAVGESNVLKPAVALGAQLQSVAIALELILKLAFYQSFSRCLLSVERNETNSFLILEKQLFLLIF